MSIGAFIPFVFGLCCLGAGFFVLLKARRSYLSRSYFFAAVTVSCYFFVRFGMVQFVDEPEFLAQWAKLFFIGTFFIVPALLNIVLGIPWQKKGLLRAITFLSTLIGFAGFLYWRKEFVVALDLFSGNAFFVDNFPWMLFCLNTMLLLPVGLVVALLQRKRQDVTELAKRQGNVMIVGITAAGAALVLTFPGVFPANSYPVGALLMMIALSAMAYSIVRYRLLEIDLFINRTVLALLFVLPLLIVHIIISAILLRTLGFLFATTFSLFVVISAVVFTPYKRLLQSLVDRAVYRGRYNYQKVLLELCQTLTAIVDFEQLFDYMVHIIVQTIEVEKMVIFLEDEDPEVFVVKTAYGVDKTVQKRLRLPAADALLVRLKREQRILVRGELRQFEDNDAVEREFAPLSAVSPEVVAPLFFKDHLIGLIVMSRKKSEHIYNEGDIEALKVFAVEAAKAIEHVRLYSEAIVDTATMVYNQNYFLTRLREEIARSKRYGHPIALIFVEARGALSVAKENGALLLKGIGLLLKNRIRNVDVLARYSGERFAIILPETAQAKAQEQDEVMKKHAEDTMIVAERLRAGIEQFLAHERAAADIAMSIGVACFDGKNVQFTEDDFILRVEKALADARKTKKTGVVFFKERDE